MSNTNLPLSATIFDRTKLGASDVPVFSQALKQKLQATQGSTIAGTGGPVVRAGSAQSGQVLAGFAPTTGQHSKEAMVTPSPYAFLAEDPTIIRHCTDTSALLCHVQAIAPAVLPPIVRPVLYPENPLPPVVVHKAATKSGYAITLPSVDTAKVLAELILQVRTTIAALIGQAEPAARRLLSLARILLSQLEELVVVWKQASGTTIRRAQDRAGALKRSVALPTLQIPTITLPSITVPTWERPEPVISEASNEKLGTDPAVVLDVVRTRVVQLQEELRAFIASLPSFHRLASQIMIACSVALMIMTVGPLVILEGQSWQQKLVASLSGRAEDVIQVTTPKPSMDPAATPSVTPQPTPVQAPAIDKRFQLQIPKIGADMRVIANVDAANPAEYEKALKEGVAHAKGTTFPGEQAAHTKTTYIFGHSTNGSWNISRYNALFYNLKDLENGDDITTWFWGTEFKYKVTDKKIVEADDVSYLQPQTDKEQLVLQTCWPPGTTWKRLLVIAEPVR